MAAGLYNTLYSIGAAGPQPGVTFGPVRSLSMGHPPRQQNQQYQHQNQHYPPSPGGSFYSANGASSPSTAYAAATTPNGYPIEKSRPPPSQQQQQQHSYGNMQPYHRASLQPSLSIRNPPQVNPRHSVGDVGQYQHQPPHTRTPDAEGSSTNFAEPPPSYEQSQSSNVSHASSSSPSTPVDSKLNTISLPSSSSNQQAPPQHNQHRPLIDASSSPSPSAAPFVASPVSTTATPLTSSALPVATVQPAPINGPANGASFVVVAKYDFNGQEDGDLPFKAGDHITVNQWTDDRESWWQGTLGTKSGCFPANYTINL